MDMVSLVQDILNTFFSLMQNKRYCNGVFLLQGNNSVHIYTPVKQELMIEQFPVPSTQVY